MIDSRFGGFEYTYIPFAPGWKQGEKDTQIPCLAMGQEGRTTLCALPTPWRETTEWLGTPDRKAAKSGQNPPASQLIARGELARTLAAK